jgi:hypothetical protein
VGQLITLSLSPQIVGLLMLVIGVWVMSIKKPYQALNDVLTSPATMTIVVAIVMLLTAAVGVIGSTKDKLLLLRVVSVADMLH